VNISANASSRPSGYTGLQLDSGSTKDGSTSFESTSGGSETGHSGNGYARITVLQGGVEEPVPEYEELSYIESTGIQYIDTGFKPNQNTRVVMDVQCLIEGNNYFLFGARTNINNNDNTALTYGFNAYNTFYRSHYYNGWKDFPISVKFTDRFILDKDKNVITIGGSNSITHTYTAFQCAYNMYLFAANTAGTAGTFGKAKLYSCQIYDNGTLVRDFVPVKRSDGVIGLYDKLNNVFYSSASDTDFTGA
jgi:hypothetical protein